MPGIGDLLALVQAVHLTDDGQAYNHPCLLWFAHVKGTAGATCNALLYDGFSTSDPLRLTLVSTTEGQADFAPPRPMKFNYGLYVVMGAGAAECVVGFDPLPES